METFCVHGSPTGYITGIRGRVQCVTDRELAKLKLSEFERMQMLQQKCYLRFPNLPFIPRQPYNVLDTDYDSYALVSGAKDASFIQVLHLIELILFLWINLHFPSNALLLRFQTAEIVGIA